VTGFVGKKINIVLNDNTVVLAELLKFSESELLVQNMRRQELSVAFTDIYEIIIDINA
jgi:chaperone required for assembly of F1-ATPase